MGSEYRTAHVQHYVINTIRPSVFPYDGCAAKNRPLDVEDVEFAEVTGIGCDFITVE